MREMSEISADIGGKTFHSRVSDLVTPKMMRVMDDKQHIQQMHKADLVTMFTLKIESSLISLLCKI